LKEKEPNDWKDIRKLKEWDSVKRNSSEMIVDWMLSLKIDGDSDILKHNA
jgi:hypothetical protein